MTRRLISSGSSFEKDWGYSRAVVDGDWIWVSGTTGFDYATMRIHPGAVEQAEQCFANIEAALAQAGAGLADVVRIQVFVDSLETWQAVNAAVIGRKLRDIRPASTALVAGFIDPRIRIEIEVTARRRGE